MSLQAELQNKFRKAVVHDVSLQQRPFYSVDEAVLREVLSPIGDVLNQDAVYGQYETDLYHQVCELRQICEEVKIAHTTDDGELIGKRNTLGLTLQGLLESVQDQKGQYIDIDFEDLKNLPQMNEVMKGYATIYREFMNQPGIANALDDVADNIVEANKRLWQPSHDAANDPEYGEVYAEVS